MIDKTTKETRPDIPKARIKTVGGFECGMPDLKWSFDSQSNPKSVGYYISDDWLLIGGYTIDELREIAGENNDL